MRCANLYLFQGLKFEHWIMSESKLLFYFVDRMFLLSEFGISLFITP